MRLREFDEKERLTKANEKLTKYKTAAGADATAADAAGNLARGNTRFKGINTATKKQFANDAKLAKLKEQGVAEGETSTPAIYVKGGGKYPGMTISPKGWTRIRDIKDEGDSYFVMVGNDGDGLNIPKDKVSPHQIKLKNGMPITAKQAFMMFNGWTPDREQGVAEGSDNRAEAYKAHLIKTLPAMMNFFAKTGKGWSPSEEQMLDAVDTAYEVMKHTGDVKQAGKALMDELNTLSKGQQGVAEQGYGNHPSQRVDPRTGKKYVPPKSPLGQGVAEGLTEMDKSQTPPGRDGNQQSPRDDRQSLGRDTGPRSGPDRYAKPITSKQMQDRALDKLNRAFRDSHKKKDVSEDSISAMRRLAGIVPQVPVIVSNGQRQYRHMPTAVQPR